MLYSHLFGKTIKEAPGDAKLTSHKLLVKGGFIRRISTGRWALLPMGLRVWEKIYKIIDEEMRAIGCQKTLVPTLHPIEIWQASNRDKAFGEEMFILKDHYGATFALGATAEGVMLEMVKMMNPTYKDLPIEVYQFSQKFRDDKRPRGGLVRVREFMMKDAYSFCMNEKQSLDVYQKYFDSYKKIAEKLGLKVIPVTADSGAIGGSLSHEFMIENEDGDQTFFVCGKCDYAANVEKATSVKLPINSEEPLKKIKTVDQPEWVNSMEDNVKFYGEPLWRYLKNVVYKDDQGRLIIACVRGDQEVNETKLRRALAVHSLTPATVEEVRSLGVEPGAVHSWGHKNVVYVGDMGLKMVRNMIGGQKGNGKDTINVNYGRDFEYEILADIVNVKKKDLCPECKKGELIEKKGFEWGHTFKIDHFYSKAQKGTFVSQKGENELMWMGSYGIGLERCMALIVEQNNDENGIIWPEPVAPFDYYLAGLDLQDNEVLKRAKEVYAKLTKEGRDVLFDDRQDISPGEKFKDADLLGIPTRLVVSKKTGDKIEVKKRTEKEFKLVDLKDLK